MPGHTPRLAHARHPPPGAPRLLARPRLERTANHCRQALGHDAPGPRTAYAGGLERGSTVRVLWACARHRNQAEAEARPAEAQEACLLTLAGREAPAP
ncbi:hypothetical protein [Streptomyces tremellae]|uniref:Uncharacterized protein n=1 Tax=Streptomyces tremellae TaxID=1124239 RepID=A0ABP7FBT3_9ACTN